MESFPSQTPTMHLSFRKYCLVQPAEPTWSGRVPLSEFDQMQFGVHGNAAYFYNPSPEWHTTGDSIIKTVHYALTRALVHFYPLAGRLHRLPNSRLELDCNGRGVELIYAESDTKLYDLGNLTDGSNLYLQSLVPKLDYASIPLEEMPLLSLQLTKFRCGGINVAFSASHAVTDGLGAFQVLKAVATLARGEALTDVPSFDKKVLRVGESPSKQLRFPHSEFRRGPGLIGGQSNKEQVNTEGVFKLSGKQVEMLKNEANCKSFVYGGDSGRRPYTRFEAVTAHIWRCACKARRHLPEQPTTVLVSVDVRRFLHPPLPSYFFGNAIVDTLAEGRSGEIIAAPLGDVAGKIRVAIDRVTEEYVQSAIDYLKGVEDMEFLQGVGMDDELNCGNPNLMVSSWAAMPIHGINFEWGKETFIATTTHGVEGDVIILPASDGGGSLAVQICLEAAVMDDFKRFFHCPKNGLEHV